MTQSSSTSISQQLESAYARASMRETAKHLQSPQDWLRVKEIQTQSNQARNDEHTNFRQEYPSRLADAREAILKERAARHYTHPAPLSAARQDRFNKDQIERQAHLRVHNAHHQTVAKINVQESREVKQLAQHRQLQPPQPTLQSTPQPVPHQQIKRTR